MASPKGRGADTKSGEIGAQHEELRELLELLTARVGSIGVEGEATSARADGLRLLQHLERLLAEHFAFEEERGYLAEELAIAPQLERRAKQLQNQHAALQKRLGELVARVVGTDVAPGRPWPILDDVLDFAGALRSHELAENLLIQEALTDDLGGG